MSETGNLGFNGAIFYGRFGERVRNPTDAEVADLLARVLEAAGHDLPEPREVNTISVERWRGALLSDLVQYRAALARDAEKAEQEQEQEIEALRKQLSSAVTGRDRENVGAIEAATRRAYALGARA